MITKAEKRIVAIVMAAMTGAVTLSTTGLSVYAEENPISVQSVETGKQYETNVVSAKDIQKYQFTPGTTGTYHFYSEGNEDTYGYVYDASQNLISSDNDSGENLNFSMDVNLEAGKNYYLAASYFMEDKTGTIQWKIESESAKEQNKDNETVSPKEDNTTSENVDNGSTELTNNDAKTGNDASELATESAEGQVAVESVNDYQYTVLNDGTVEITGYTGKDATLNIPETIQGKSVSSIGKEAFKENATVENVTIPKNVTTLQYMSFASCSNLQKITFSADSKLKTIEAGTFWQCSKLGDVNCPSGLEKIKDFAFSGCENMTHITFGKSLKLIGNSAFVSSGLKSVDIPDSVTELGAYAFWGCGQLESVILGKGFTEIKEFTFSCCTKLTDIIIPNNIKSIGKNAFYMSGLKQVNIPDSVTSIGEEAFANCAELSQVSIGNGLSYIAKSAFFSCNLNKITIGNKVKNIEDYAFEYNTELKNVSIPKNVTEIQYAVFRGCTSLENIEIPDTLEKIGGNSFAGTKWYDNQKDGVVYAGKVLYRYKGTAPKDTTIDVKKDTKSISSFAFENQVNIKKITLPEGMTSIGDFALYNCSSISSISIPTSVKEIGKYAIGYKVVEDSSEGVMFPGEGEDTRYELWPRYHTIIPGFVIYGEAGSTAEKYAKQNNINFKKNVHTVIFKDGNKIIDTQKVTSGESAKAPKIEKEGYIFKGWSGNYTNVTADSTITAKWEVNEKTKTGVFKASDGNWYYYKNGQKDTGFTGLAENENGIWYCKKGQVQFNTTDVIESKGTYNGWYYVKKGQLQTGQITVKGNKNGWWYIDKNGRVDFNFTGLAKNENGIWYCKKGQVQFGTTDVIESKGTYNGWYYVKKGQLQTGKETVEQNSTGWWYINKDGKVDFNFNGLAKNGNGIWYCKKGKVQFNATDVLHSKGTYEGWYYVKKGQLQTGKVTVEQNSTGWWYIAKDGKVDFSFTGIASNAYGSWYLEKGKVNFNKNISAYTDPHTKLLYKVVKGKATRIKEHVYTESKRDLQYIYYKCKDCGATKKEFNDQTYTIDLGNGKTTTVVGHFDLEMRQEILDLVNKKRVIWGSKLLSLPPMESSLQNAANIRAYEIIYSYSHTRPNGERGITSFNVDGENLAEGFTSASDVCQAWFSSESHFRNITNNSYNTMGVGVFCAKTDYGYENYFSQMFSCDKLE